MRPSAVTRALAGPSAFALALAAALLVGVAPAAADEQPSIVKAYGLDWIERVDESAWPQPKAQRPIICLLDTGVAVTPDTPEDNPDGPIVARLAIDGGSGLPQGNTFFHMHGTSMASVIAAPRNGYGTVGVFPQARIVSVRVTIDDGVFIAPASVRKGAGACQAWAEANPPTRIGAVVMAESNYDQRPEDAASWDLASRRVQDTGGAFVAAVGNSPDASLVAPSITAGILPVAAGDDAGGLCSFAKYPATAGLIGPGCSGELIGGQTVWPAGSSAATAATGALLGALAARVPVLDGAARVQMVRAAATSTATGNVLNGAPIAASPFAITGSTGAPSVAAPTAGLVVGEARGASEPNASAPRLRLWRPSFRLRRAGSALVVRRTDHRGAGRLTVRVGVGSHAPIVSAAGRTLRIRSVRSGQRLGIWIDGGKHGSWRSLTRLVKVPSR